MSQSINKIHSSNLIQPSNDEDLYIYANSKWIKLENTLHKFYNKNIDLLDKSQFKEGDYIALYNKKKNHICYSEIITKERNYNKLSKTPTKDEKYYWVRNNINVNSKYTFELPYTYQNMLLLETMNESKVNGPVEHSMSQIFYNKHMKTMCFSCYVKNLNNSSDNNVLLSLFSDTYNVGIYATFLLNDNNPRTTIEPLIVDKSYYQNSSHLNKFKSLISNMSANIEKITINDNIYHRIYITGKFDFVSQFRCQLNILNRKNDIFYESTATTEKYSLYASGFQLEEVDKTLTPTTYITTRDKPIQLNILNNIYRCINGELSPINNCNIHYFDTIKEVYSEEDDRIYIESYTPQLDFVYTNDIGVVSSILSFSNTEIEKNKKIINDRNTNKDSRGDILYSDDISEIKQQEMLSDGVVRLGSMDDGKDKSNEYPLYSIYYDKKLKEYRFNKENGFVTFKYKSLKPIYKSILNALTFNQGYFETWSSKGKSINKHGFNTGGGYNFWKLNKHRR